MSKNSKNNKGDGVGEKKTASVAVVLKVNMHCDGCASKFAKSVRAIQGVETVKAESGTGKVTVTGDVDPTKLREQLEVKTRKKVELVSPKPNNKESKEKNTSKEDKKEEKKTEEKKPKEAPVTTAVLKLDFHGQGCIDRIQKTVTKTQGVSGLSIDKEKQLVTVQGTMDVKNLANSLAEKLKRNVEIVLQKESGGNRGGKGVNKMEYVAAQPAHESAYDSNEDGDSIPYYALKIFSDENPDACVVM